MLCFDDGEGAGHIEVLASYHLFAAPRSLGEISRKTTRPVDPNQVLTRIGLVSLPRSDMSTSNLQRRADLERDSFTPPTQAHRPGPMDVAIRRLERLARLDEFEKEAVRSLCGPLLPHRLGADLGDDSDGSCRFLVNGWACRVRETPWGGRQILEFMLPGDAVGYSPAPGLNGMYRAIALTRGASVDASSLRQQVRSDPNAFPGLTNACQQWERGKALRMHEHTVRLGGASASQAMAHLLLELRGRMNEIGQLEGTRFPMPLSQDTLHEALGITSTQVYRVLTQLKRDGLVAIGSGWADIPNPAKLARAAGLEGWRG